MPGILIGLLLLWVIIIGIGLAVKAIFWLAILGMIAFVATLIGGLATHWRR